MPAAAPSEATELAAAFNEMLERLEAERRDSVGRALDAQEGERLRVAQELHDEVGQTLTGVVLQLGRAAKRRAEPTCARACCEAQETARESLEEVRRIAPRLRPEALDDLGLAERAARARRARRRAVRLDVDVHVQPALPDLDAGRGARGLPRRPGGADQRRAPRRRHARRGAARAARRPPAARGRRRRPRAVAPTARRAAASAACASAPC